MLFKVTTSPTPANPQIKDTEFKKFFPAINRGTEWCTIEPFVQQAEDNEIIPAIGLDFYNILNDEYQANGTIANDTKAYTFRLLRTALAYFAMYKSLPQLTLRIGDAGTNENTTDGTAPVRQWVYNGSRWEIVKTAYLYLDMALEHMEKQVKAENTDYDAFKDSDAYTVSIELLIANAREFQQYYNIKTSRRAYTALRPYIRKAEELKLKDVLYELYDEIKEQIADDSLSDENTALLPDIKRLLAEYTLIYAIPDINFINDGEGWMISENNYDSRLTPNQIDKSLQHLQTRAESNAAQYEIVLKNVLYSNLDDYPTFRDGVGNDLTEDSDGDGIPDVEVDDDPGIGAVII